MSDERPTHPVKRFGRKDRKKSLETRGSLFPADDTRFMPPAAQPTVPPESLPEVETRVEAEPEVIETVAEPEPLAPVKAPSKPKPQPRPRLPVWKSCLANLVTLLFTLGTIGAIAVFSLIASNPNTPLNPFPPFTPVPIFITATFLPPTNTSPPALGATATFTPFAVNTPSSADAAFVLAGDEATYAANSNTEGCNWASLAGTVTDASGAGLRSYGVQVTGEGVDQRIFSGTSATFGEGGFELFLGPAPLEQTYMVQLFTPQGEPASVLYTIVTRAVCEENVTILRFVSSR